MSTRHPAVDPGHRGPRPPTATPPDSATRVHGAVAGADGPGDAAEAEPLLYTVDQAAALLQVRPSWLRRKAAARAVSCTFLGKHLRFSRADLDAIITGGSQETAPARQRPPTVPARRRPAHRPG